jgi:hypothetical protein
MKIKSIDDFKNGATRVKCVGNEEAENGDSWED